MGALKIRSIKVWAGNIEAAILNGQAKGPLQHAISKNHLSIKDLADPGEPSLVGDIYYPILPSTGRSLSNTPVDCIQEVAQPKTTACVPRLTICSLPNDPHSQTPQEGMLHRLILQLADRAGHYKFHTPILK